MSQTVAADQHAVIGIPSAKPEVPSDFVSNPHPEARWFRQRNFGAFFHWGISAVRGEVDLSWGMISGTAYDLGVKITPREYFAQAAHFRPDAYDPEAWLREAADAGINHAVLTTKHHDGFALWPSAFGNFNTKNFYGGRDLVREFVEACAKTGVRPGLYYSPPDWYYNRHRMSFRRASDGSPANPHLGMEHEPISLPPFDAAWEKDFHAYLRGQIEELLTQYGPIHLLFFDGRPEVISLERIRELQPSILVNERMHGYGDFATPECYIPKDAPAPPWEVVETWDVAGRWGFAAPFINRPAAWVAERLRKVQAMGGNYMINLAPQSDGTLPDQVRADLHWLAHWQKATGECMDRTLPVSPALGCNAPGVVKDNLLYLFPEYPLYHLLQVTGVPKPVSVTLLNKRCAIPFGHVPTFKEGPRLKILIPPELQTGGDVVRVEFPADFVVP